MGVVHSFAAFEEGGLTGIQKTQRDWSPYLVHFTSWKAMTPVRSGLGEGLAPEGMAEVLRNADRGSIKIAKLILSSRTLRAATPSSQTGGLPCVCFTECNLPGIISHCERYGRFGFVVKKEHVYGRGGSPCLYLPTNLYAEVSRQGTAVGATEAARRLLALANVYSPPQHGKVQDYTHEREWRLFADLPLDQALAAVLCPAKYFGKIRSLLAWEIPVVPIDTLFDWGA